METTPTIFSELSRFSVAVIALAIIYIRLGPPNYVETEIMNEIFYLLIMPLLLISGTLACCYFVGLPIRLIPKVLRWWRHHQVVPLLLLFTGIALCFLSAQPKFTTSETVRGLAGPIAIPNFNLLATGWCLTGFSLTHLYLGAIIFFLRKTFRF